MPITDRGKLNLLSVGLALSCVFLLVQPVRAHPADMFFQSYALQLSANDIQLALTVVPGPMIVPLLWSDVDQDQDGQVSPAEAQTWAAPLLSQFTARVGDMPLQWQLASVEWPASLEKFQGGAEKIVVQFSAAWPTPLTGLVQLKLHNPYQEPISINWFSIQGKNGLTFHTPQQFNGALQVAVVMPGGVQASSAPADKTLLTYWDSGTPSLEAAAAQTIGLTGITQQASGTQPTQDPRPAAILTNLMRSGQLSLGFFLLAFVIAGVLGSLHALTPGHGKTIVAAYLVGSRGTTRHAVSLGAIVTLTHTGSVFALGLVALAASQYILPAHLFPLLEVASGLLIVGLGAYLLYGRWRAWRTGYSASHQHDHNHHPHDHHHDHHHSHHHLPDAAGVSWRSLVTLGISGGLVPCPDAIAILLVAVALNRLALGLSLIVAFSLGLALVLMGVGLVLVHSRRLFERMDAFNRMAPALPLLSAMIVLLLGLGLTYNATQTSQTFTPAGVTPAQVQALPGSAIDPFQLDQARILYMVPDEQNRLQLVVRQLKENQPVFLTQGPSGVQDYVLSPAKNSLIYTVPHDDGTTELWIINTDGSNAHQVLTCPKSACGGVAWSPDGQHLVYEKDDLPVPDNSLNLPSLWWLDLATGQTAPVFPNSQWPGSNPGWSDDGQWLSYTSAGSGQVEIYNLKDGRRHTIPGQTDRNVAWQPDSSALLVGGVQTQAAGFLIHLLHFNLQNGKLVDLSEEANTEDTAPAWSADGQWIAVMRRELANPDRAKNLQLWVMRADGSQARRLTNQTDALYGALSWSPDGKYLLFHQYILKQQRQPQVWLLNVQTGELQLVASPGSWPAWLPN